MGRGNVVMVSVERVLRSEPAATPRWYGIAASCDEMEFDRDDLARSFHIGERFSIVPKIEVFNLFNNKKQHQPADHAGTV